MTTQDLIKAASLAESEVTSLFAGTNCVSATKYVAVSNTTDFNSIRKRALIIPSENFHVDDCVKFKVRYHEGASTATLIE